MNSFKKWYAKNADKLSEQRKLRYHNDSVYRQQAKDRAAKSRSKTPKAQSPNKKFGEVAKLLDISTVTLRTWKRKDYYPEPKKEGRYVVFTPEQIDMLIELKNVFVKHDWNLRSQEAQDDLDNAIRLTYANWS